MKHTFNESLEILRELGFDDHYYSGDHSTIGMTQSCDNRGKNTSLFDAIVTYNITYNVNDDTFELAYNTKRWTFCLKSGIYSNIDRDDIGSIMFDFFLYCRAISKHDKEY